jgi:uncharacterized protein (TIGR01370 family)
MVGFLLPFFRALRAALSGAVALFALGCTTLPGVHTWAVFYGAKATDAALQTPDLLVLEPDQPWNPALLRRTGQLVLAYLSLGEVNESRAYFQKLDPSALLGKNPHWPGAMTVDPGNASWRSEVLDKLAPSMLQQGYDGFFLDTLDVGAELERQGHPGALKAMAGLVNELKARYPQAVIVANGGLDLLPDAAHALSALAVESVVTNYDFNAQRYLRRAPEQAQARIAQLQGIQRQYGLSILTIEYVSPQTPGEGDAIALSILQAGFVPFVSDIGLNTLKAPVSNAN